MIAAGANTTVLSLVVAVIAAALGGGGFAALLKARSDKRKTEVDSAQVLVSASADVVMIQKGVLDDMREENRRLSERLTALEAEVASVGNLHQRIGRLENERQRLRTENDRLKERVRNLEEELTDLRRGSS